MRPAQGEAPAAVEDAVHSQQSPDDWIGDSQTWKEQGSPVGSGLVERAVAVVINLRRKTRGMRWKRANATAVVA